MNELPSFSIVSVTRNDLPGLRQTRLSVAAQDYEGVVEHIIIDGASSDGTREWLTSLESAEQGVVVLSEPDEGPYDAMNKGARLARCDLLIFLNGGDRLSGSSTLRLIAESHAREEWKWATGISRMRDAGGQHLRLHHNVPFKQRRFVLGLKSLPHQSTIMDRATFHAIGPFDVRVGLAADQDLLFRALKIGQPGSIFEIVADCDAEGWSSTQRPDSFAWQMSRIRGRHGARIFRSRVVDLIVTCVSAALLRMHALSKRARNRLPS